MKFYGSYQNRIEENRQFVEKIAVGMGVTEYLYSDRTPYEVIAVKDQKHITIRQLDAKRIDENGLSECQDYEYTSNEDNYTVELVKRGQYWYAASTLTRDELERIEARNDADSIGLKLWASRFDWDKVKENGKQTKYHKMNISIGKAERYFDPSF